MDLTIFKLPVSYYILLFLSFHSFHFIISFHFISWFIWIAFMFIYCSWWITISNCILAMASVIPGSPGPPAQIQQIISTPSPRPSILRKRGDGTGTPVAAKRRLPFMDETPSSPSSSSQPVAPPYNAGPTPPAFQSWVICILLLQAQLSYFLLYNDWSLSFSGQRRWAMLFSHVQISQNCWRPDKLK